ncbi:MAG TPA: ERAP1-like C-terminal domain-containing protein, partial [Pseudolysinimonas sp.]|nr:ERAP1-like C-terminal domain-containing protein [Pseudolysinimonas sp.]
DLAYAKIRMDERSFRTAMEHLADIEDPLARALVWGAAWDATRDAEVAPSDYVRLVLDNIATETESTTIRLTLTQLLQAARSYVAPEKRADTIREVGDALWQLARDAEAGSDAQFQFVKFFAAIASTTAHGDALSGLRDGSIALPGLDIDADLSWELLEGLVLVGAAGETEIAEALAADNTANGQQSAARARATIPTADAKRAAFELGSRDGSVPNTTLRNTGLGYTHVNDPASLEALVAPYFEMLEGVWRERSYTIASYIVLGFYPSPLASQELVDATRTWLDEHPDIPALRRLVAESLAGVERALRAQDRDARD